MNLSRSLVAARSRPIRLTITFRISPPMSAVITTRTGNKHINIKAENWKALFMKSTAFKRAYSCAAWPVFRRWATDPRFS